MNLEQLNSFLTVAQHMNFTKAADSLFVSHSTISRQIASLEKNLGVRLLIRDNRSVRLTKAGAILLERGQALFEEITEIENLVRLAGSGRSGSLRVASLDFYHQSLYNLYKRFTREYPDIIFSIQHADIGSITEQITSERADVGIAFSYEWDSYPDEFEYVRLYSESFCVVVAEDHHLASRDSIRLSDLKDESMLFLDHLLFDFFKRFDKEMGRPVIHNSAVQPKSGQSLIIQVRAGLGVSALPRPLARELCAGCKLLEIEGCDTSFDVLMLWRKNSINPSLPLFLDMASGFYPDADFSGVALS